MKIKGIVGEFMSDFKIPQGWQVEYLKDLSTDGIKNGVFNDPKKVGEGAKLINVVNLYSGAHINTEKLTRLNLTEQEIAKYKVEVGDVFFTRSSLVLNGIAQCNINLDDSDDIVFDGHVMRVRPNSKKVVPFYLKEFCLSDSAKKFFMRHAKTTTMTTIGQEEVGKLPVLLPPKEEQEKIVAILSSWDKAIELKEKLIEQKKEQKKGLMQGLLTGEVRLPGYRGRWEKVDFEEVFLRIPVKRNQIKTNEYLKKGKFPVVDQGKQKIIAYSDDEDKVYQVDNGVIIFGDHTRELKFIDFDFIVGADGTQVLDTNNGYNIKFYYYSLLNKNIPNTGYNRHFKFLKEMWFYKPTMEEQLEIANLLWNADKEINLIFEELELLKLQKQALMQQLLTGKIRVKV